MHSNIRIDMLLLNVLAILFLSLFFLGDINIFVYNIWKKIQTGEKDKYSLFEKEQLGKSQSFI